MKSKTRLTSSPALAVLEAVAPRHCVLALHAALIRQGTALQKVDPADVESGRIELISDLRVRRSGGARGSLANVCFNGCSFGEGVCDDSYSKSRPN